MPADSLSMNPCLIPPEKAEYYQVFFQRQDELSHRIPFTSKKGNIWPEALVQVNMQDSALIAPPLLSSGQTLKRHDPIPITTKDPGWVLGLFLLCLILVVVVKVSFPRRLEQIFNAFVSPRSLNVLIKEGNLSTERITPPLIIILLISNSLFLYQLAFREVSFSRLPFPEIVVFAGIFAAISLLFAFRVVLIRVLGWIFRTGEQSRNYIVNGLVIQSVWGLILLPLSVFIFYLRAPAASIVLMISAVLFLLLFIYLLVRSFMLGLSVHKFSRVYLILYLCTVEILPILVFGKIASNYLLISGF